MSINATTAQVEQVQLPYALINDDCLAALKDLPDNCVESLVTDPPAGIAFMGKEWDKDKGGRDAWIKWMSEIMRECLRVLKPGAHGLIWAIPRTSHWTATALEDAGFEVRDVVTHLFGTGFPKSLDVSKAIDKAAGAEREVIGSHKKAGDIKGGRMHANSNEIAIVTEVLHTLPATDAAKQWQGWGTALKPASEHWILVRKPISEKTVAANVLKWGVGGINIDECRVGTETLPAQTAGLACLGTFERAHTVTPERIGRFPANLVLSEDAPAMLDEQSGTSKSQVREVKEDDKVARIWEKKGGWKERKEGGFVDSGGASRFFYCAKASKSDKSVINTHPTVKSTKLMEYLITLITPPDGLVLDPFAGSGSTGVAAINKGFSFIGIEREAEYANIAEARLLAASNKGVAK